MGSDFLGNDSKFSSHKSSHFRNSSHRSYSSIHKKDNQGSSHNVTNVRRGSRNKKNFSRMETFNKKHTGISSFSKENEEFNNSGDFKRDKKFERSHLVSQSAPKAHSDSFGGPRSKATLHRNRKRQLNVSVDAHTTFPSQNPYTARRPNEPRMPKGITWDMLSAQDKARLRGLSKEHAENIGLHMLAAYMLEDVDQDWALEHAHWVASQASRIEAARETLGLIAYRAGKYKLAARELRTALRMNGETDYLPLIADCERGMGRPQKALEVGDSDMAQALRGPEKVEMMLVMAGAYADMKKYDKAIKIVDLLLKAQGISGEYRMRAAQAKQYFLEEAGDISAARNMDDLVRKMEEVYADKDVTTDPDELIDNDIEIMSEEDFTHLNKEK